MLRMFCRLNGCSVGDGGRDCLRCGGVPHEDGSMTLIEPGLAWFVGRWGFMALRVATVWLPRSCDQCGKRTLPGRRHPGSSCIWTYCSQRCWDDSVLF